MRYWPTYALLRLVSGLFFIGIHISSALQSVPVKSCAKSPDFAQRESKLA